MLTQILFLLFVLSGFCSLIYQVVWLRLAFGAFGIVTPVLSVVVSVFMLGLALGSWGAGRGVNTWMRRTGLSPIHLYASSEVLIGLSAFLVPVGLDAGRQWLFRAGQIDSPSYLACSGIILSLVLLPPCIAMGTTFPLMLAYIKGVKGTWNNSFSFLYLGNRPTTWPGRETPAACAICFGMGTTYRSALSWGVDTTAVDLARAVPEAFPYYFEDAPLLRQHPKGRIVIDDGRRFLHRNRVSFDVITIDPPPPLEAAGSSLLYSTEFYELLKTRLNPGGILQQWNPGGEPLITSAIARSLVESFDYVVAFPAIEGGGIHYTASMSPIRIPSAEHPANPRYSTQ